MILIIGIGVVMMGRYAVRHSWPGTEPARAWWHDHRHQLTLFVRSSPATFVYLAILTVTTWVLAGTSRQIGNALLADQSTNLHHLTHDPAQVLIRSAFWLGDYRLLFWFVLFLVVLAPAERWLGSRRWIVAFVAGHVGATVLTAAGIWLAIRTGAASHRLDNVVDVGVSYGLASTAGLLTYRLPGRWRWIWSGTLTALAIGGILISGDFTSYGHATALLIGFALYPLSRAPAVRARATGPLFIPTTTPRTHVD